MAWPTTECDAAIVVAEEVYLNIPREAFAVE